MVGEAYLGGDFTTLKQRAIQQGVQLTDQWWRGIFQQCFEGMKFMHAQAMIHCDLKEPNMMLKTTNFHSPAVVIIDFGVSKAMVDQAGGPRGTPGYIPPETLDSGKWFPRGDCFSMGVAMIQLLTDKVPPQGARTTATPGGIFIEGCMTVQDIFNATREREPPYHLLHPSQSGLTRLLRQLLSKQMNFRSTPTQVLKDAWFANVLPEHEVKGRHARATVGITKSFIANLDSMEDEAGLPPAQVALLQLQRNLGVAHPPHNGT